MWVIATRKNVLSFERFNMFDVVRENLETPLRVEGATHYY